MKKKTVIVLSIVLAVFILILNLVLCEIYSLFSKENNIYLLGVIVLPLLPFALLLSIPNFEIKLKGKSDKQNNDTD